MHEDEFKYDLAISFVASDELLATELADQFEGRLRVFLYSRKQEQLGGTDGEKTFNDVFAKQSRLVVVLYRAGWGETPWTRIEETAIRNRAYDHGYDFVLFIPLDESPSVPKWLPRTQLWIGLARWGISGAASVIDARFQELGGIPIHETIEHRAARLEKSFQHAQARKEFLSSDDGVRKATKSFESVMDAIVQRVPTLQESAPSLKITVKQAANTLALLGRGPALLVKWETRFSNSLTDSKLDASLWRGHPPFPGIRLFDEPRRIDRKVLLPDLLLSRDACWSPEAGTERKQFSSDQTAEFILSWWLDTTRSEHERNIR